MRVPRIYINQTLSLGEEVTLPKNSSRHLVSVLRMKDGQSAILFNGEGGEFIGKLTNASKTNSSVLIDGFSAVEKESNLKIHLAIGVSKGDRMDWIIQKATELGVTEISPIFTGRTEVKLSGSRLDKKLSHWQQIAISMYNCLFVCLFEQMHVCGYVRMYVRMYVCMYVYSTFVSTKVCSYVAK